MKKIQISFIILLFSTIVLSQDDYYEVKLTMENPTFGQFYGNPVSIDGVNASIRGEDGIHFYRLIGEEWLHIQTVSVDYIPMGMFGSISDIDGNYCIAGYYVGENSVEEAHKIEIYHFDGDFWNADTLITKSDLGDDDVTHFGLNVTIQDSLIVATALTSEAVRAYLFELNNGQWNIQTYFEKDILEPFGGSISINDDMICFGAPVIDQGSIESAGAVYCYQYVGSDWVEMPRINPITPGNFRYFGMEILLFEDYLFVGEPGGMQSGPFPGLVRVFQYIEDEWVYQYFLIASDFYMYDNFGNQIKGAGEKICIGADLNDDGGSGSGSAYIYSKVTTESGAEIWTEEKKIISSDLAYADNFGVTLDVTDNYVIVGAPMKDNFSGAAYIFDPNDTSLHANFAGDVRNGNAPVTVQFTSVPQGNPNTYEWDFNSDGFVDSTEPNPQFTYQIDGTYTVTLTVYDESGSDDEVKTDYIQVVSDILFGDVNQSGSLDVGDLVLFVAFVLGNAEPTEDQFFAGDVNYSGQIDIIDIVMVIHEILGDGLQRTGVLESAEIRQSDNSVSLLTAGAIAGLQIEVNDNWTLDEINLSDGWDLHVGSSTILIFSPFGATLTNDAELFTYSGELIIGEITVTDYLGNNMTAKLSHILPTEYRLHHIYPNPFNPTTTITYDIPIVCEVIVSIYDINGRLVTTLIDQLQSAGVHSIVWDASKLSSGSYFVRMLANEFSDVQKVVLLK